MTSSIQPPVLDPPLGTPSSEWAKKTTSSLDPSSQQTPQNTTPGQATGQSPGVTPGNELPGAFPDRGQGETSTGTTNITETLVDTAKQFLPASVVNTFISGTNNPAGASGTNKGVRASEHDIYHKPSLPSQELSGALPQEHVGGVGSLPGASIEKSVALLPDQQAEWSQYDTFAGRNTPGYQTPNNLRGNTPSLSQTVTQKATNLAVAAGIVKADVPTNQTDEDVGKGYPETLTSGDISGAKQAVGNIKPVAFDIKQAHDVSMPSTETQGQQLEEHTDGVGSLPGPNNEQGVAILPEERATKPTESVHSEHREELGGLPGEPKSTGAGGVGVSGATDLLKPTQSKDLPAEPTPSELKTTSSEPGQPHGAFDESENLDSVKGPGSSEGSAEAQRKASLKDKISGGIKVVSGKLGNDKSKVEEGKKLIHGQSA
jgi:hypothetical protein